MGLMDSKLEVCDRRSDGCFLADGGNKMSNQVELFLIGGGKQPPFIDVGGYRYFISS